MTLQCEDPLSVFNLASLRFPDDFDEYLARADSGGSTYGLLKRHAFAHSSLRERPTTEAAAAAAALQKPAQRQRSKSLIPPAVAASRLKCLADEKSLIKALAQQSTDESSADRNTLQLQVVDYRRHSSTATCTASMAPDLRKRGSYAFVQDSSAPSAAGSTMQGEGGRQGGWSPVSVPVCRRRSFSVTPQGLVNEGDEVIPVIPSEMLLPDGGTGLLLQLQMTGGSGSRRSSSNSCVEGGGGQQGSDDGSSNDASVHRVLMLGGPGVGKTALTQQFLTSEFMAAQNTSFDDGREITVPVLLDGEESIMEFIDLPYSGELDVWRDYDVDGYIIVYSITDRRSYQKASDVMTAIKDSWNNIRPIILVANKSDLERSRMIGKEEGKGLAQSNDCKYIEVSAILNHKVDDLLVGMLKQIRLSILRQKKLNKHRQSTATPGSASTDPRRPTIDIERASGSTTGDGGGGGCGETEEEERGKGCLSTKPCRNGVFAKLFRGTKKMSSKSCENLLTS